LNRWLHFCAPAQRAGQSKYNPIFEFGYTLSHGANATMLVTSVLGHILQVDIDAGYGWGKCDPADCFFKAPLVTNVGKVCGGWAEEGEQRAWTGSCSACANSSPSLPVEADGGWVVALCLLLRVRAGFRASRQPAAQPRTHV
jgi:hypothetical protein